MVWTPGDRCPPIDGHPMGLCVHGPVHQSLWLLRSELLLWSRLLLQSSVHQRFDIEFKPARQFEANSPRRVSIRYKGRRFGGRWRAKTGLHTSISHEPFYWWINCSVVASQIFLPWPWNTNWALRCVRTLFSRAGISMFNNNNHNSVTIMVTVISRVRTSTVSLSCTLPRSGA